MADLDRLLAKMYIAENGCWIWTASCDDLGYGQFRLDGSIRAHRASWILHNGPIAPGMKVLHKCDFPCCINPEHLFLGTDADNMRDRQNKGRQARGEFHGSATFTEDDVRLIRQMRAEGSKIKEISEYFGAALGTVSNICSGHTWAWLKE